jgi:hypothetical protein
MKTNHCCENSRAATFVRRFIEVAGWIVPSTILTLIPKCPACLAAYIALWSGIGLSLSAAMYLRTSLLVLCAGVILFLAVWNARRLIHKFGQCETTTGGA